MNRDQRRDEDEAWDELSAMHTEGCDRQCEHFYGSHMNACVVAEYQEADPTWGYSMDDLAAIANGRKEPDPNPYWTVEQTRDAAERAVIHYLDFKVTP